MNTDHQFGRQRRRSIEVAGIVFALLLSGALPARAEEPAAPPTAAAEGDAEPSSQPDERFIAERAIASLDEAARRLRDSAADSRTVELQRAAVQDLDELLKRLKSSSAPSSPPQTSSEGESAEQQKTGSSSDSSGGANSNRDAAQSSEQAEGGDHAKDAEIARRRDLAQSTWGHLPPKMQEELQRSFSERFVPKYEELIRQYYEALAEQKLSE